MEFLRAFAPDRPLIAIFVVLAESRLSHPLAPLPQHTGTVSLGPDFGPLRPDWSRAGMRRTGVRVSTLIELRGVDPIEPFLFRGWSTGR